MDKEVLKVQIIDGVEQVQIHSAEGSFLSILVNSEKLIPPLLAQINADIKEKVEQDVELLGLEVSGPNSLIVQGQAGVMGIKKEFDVHCSLSLHKESQVVQLLVSNIDVKGGFLVRKGFELIEPKIQSMIEKAVKIDIAKLLEKASFSLTIPDTEKLVQLIIQQGTVHEFLIEPRDKQIHIQLDFSLQIQASI